MSTHQHSIRGLLAAGLLCFLSPLGAFSCHAATPGTQGHQARKGVSQNGDDDPRLQEYEKPGVRFDILVREDFFAGMFGDNARLDRGMRFCERVLAKHPRHGEALVWHGGGLLSRAALAYEKGDSAIGDQLFQRGLKEMDDAKSFEPENMGVRIGRAATLIGISQSGFDPADRQARQLLESAARDYEQVLAWQQPRFSTLAMHNRGELLFGLASAWSMLGDQAKTRSYLERITVDCRGSSYEQEARSFLEQKPMPVVKHDCQGCHVH